MININNFFLTEDIINNKASSQLVNLIKNGEGYRLNKPKYVNFKEVFEYNFYDLNRKDIPKTILSFYNPTVEIESIFKKVEYEDEYYYAKDILFYSLINYISNLFNKDKSLYAIWLCTDANDVFSNYNDNEFKNTEYYGYKFKEEQKYFIASDLDKEGFLIVSNKPFELEKVVPYTEEIT